MPDTGAIFLCNYFILCFLLRGEFSPFLPLIRECVIKWVLQHQLKAKSRVTSDSMLIFHFFYLLLTIFTIIIQCYLIWNFSDSWAIFLSNNPIPSFLFFAQFSPLLTLKSKSVILWVFFLQLIPESHIRTESRLITEYFDSYIRIITIKFALTPLAQYCVLWHTFYLDFLVELVFWTKIFIMSLLLFPSFYVLLVPYLILFCTILVVLPLLNCKYLIVDFFYLFFEFFFVKISMNLLDILEPLLKIMLKWISRWYYRWFLFLYRYDLFLLIRRVILFYYLFLSHSPLFWTLNKKPTLFRSHLWIYSWLLLLGLFIMRLLINWRHLWLSNFFIIFRFFFDLSDIKNLNKFSSLLFFWHFLFLDHILLFFIIRWWLFHFFLDQNLFLLY